MITNFQNAASAEPGGLQMTVGLTPVRLAPAAVHLESTVASVIKALTGFPTSVFVEKQPADGDGPVDCGVLDQSG